MSLMRIVISKSSQQLFSFLLLITPFIRNNRPLETLDKLQSKGTIEKSRNQKFVKKLLRLKFLRKLILRDVKF